MVVKGTLRIVARQNPKHQIKIKSTKLKFFYRHMNEEGLQFSASSRDEKKRKGPFRLWTRVHDRLSPAGGSGSECLASSGA